jgi:hypothetical protein
MNALRIIAWATALGMTTSAAFAYDVNKDLRNIGTQPAYDVAVVLAGQENVTAHFDGYAGRRFGSFSSGPSGPNTLLHWQNLIEPGGNGRIDPNEVVHVGWSTADHSSHVLDMYWTDQSGNRIPGSIIFNITSDWTYESGFVALSWDNIFETEWGDRFPLDITEVAVGVFPTPWPLSELNAQNEALNEALQPLPDGSFVLEPDQVITLPVPATVPTGGAVVVRYQVTGPGGAAFAVDWVQFVPEPFPPPMYFVNKDLQNVGGQPAFDLAIVLAGQQTISDHFDGYSDRHFGSFSSGPSGPNTLLHWQNVIEPDGNGAIDPGEVVHVGWGTSNQTHVVDMYWTDQSGNRIPGSKIYNITSGWTYESGSLVVSWDNIFVTEWGETSPIEIMDVAVGIFPQAWALSELNAQNEALNEALQPLPAGSFVVDPGGSVSLPVPGDVPPDGAVVARYQVMGPGSEALAIDWVQIVPPPPPPPPMYFVNKDLQNIGTQSAYDLAIVLAGQQTIGAHYDGYPERQFGSFSSGPSGPNTLLHWQNLVEPGGNGAIDPGEIVHVGWGTASPSHVVDMYWTDQSGNRIPGSRVFNITSDTTYGTGGVVVVSWDNIFVAEGEVFPIDITDVSVGVFPDPWPLSELNLRNEALNDALQPLPDGTFVVAPDQPVTLTLPDPVPAGSALVLRYGVTGAGDSALATDWIEIIIPPPPPPPMYFVNKDLQNIGTQSAYDLAIVLSGQQTIGAHYDGYPERQFGSFSSGPSGPNTLLHWQNLVEPDGNGAIDPGEIVHVGWGSASPSHVLDMYWTDQSGNRIPGSKIFNITSDWTYETSGVVTVTWDNIFVTDTGEVFPIDISDVSVAVFTDPWPLSELNAQNEVLNGALQPLSAGTFVVTPDQPVTLTLPMPVPDGSAVVLRYGVTGADDSADAMDWVQFITPPPATGACCISTSCEGNMSADECAAIGGEWNAGEECGVFICPGEEIRCTPGDINGDGLINGYDIDPFVAVLVGTVTDPDWMCSADANGDGLVNGYDIDPFVTILTSGGAVTVGYEHACDGRNYTWSVNAPVGRCYLVTAAKDGTESECPVTVQAHDNTHRVIGGSLVLQPGLSGEFCMPEGATHLDYRCQSSSGQTCRFSWQLE